MVKQGHYMLRTWTLHVKNMDTTCVCLKHSKVAPIVYCSTLTHRVTMVFRDMLSVSSAAVYLNQQTHSQTNPLTSMQKGVTHFVTEREQDNYQSHVSGPGRLTTKNPVTRTSDPNFPSVSEGWM